MKKIFFALFCLYSTWTGAQTLSEYPYFSRFEQENQTLIEQQKHPKVIFLGNSITEAWANTRPTFFTDHDFLGRGISGQTSPQLLLRFQRDVVALKPKKVVINIGTNDIAENTGKYNLTYTLDNIRSMVEIAKANRIKVYLSSVLPVDVYPWRKEIEHAAELVKELNHHIQALAKEKKVPYIDYYTPMCKENGGLIDAYTYDGVHPTAAGYEVMEAIVLKAIR